MHCFTRVFQFEYVSTMLCWEIKHGIIPNKLWIISVPSNIQTLLNNIMSKYLDHMYTIQSTIWRLCSFFIWFKELLILMYHPSSRLLYFWLLIPDRALIRVLNNPSMMEKYLSWAIYLRNWNFLHPIITYKSRFCHFRWPYLFL